MNYCPTCGKQLNTNEKNCNNCGTQIINQPTFNEKRTTIYEGEIHKCPNCGEVLKSSFEIVCPNCKYEFRYSKKSDNLNAFVNQLNNEIDENKKIDIVKNFPIPNTKDDIFEFMLLAYSNFDIDYYLTHLEQNDISDAWLIKIKQCYQKAKLLFTHQELNKIEDLYLEINNNIKKRSTQKKVIKATSIFAIIIGILLILSNNIIAIQVIGISILICGIVGVSINKSKKQNEIKVQNKVKKGFSSWSGIVKFGWIVLNIYTLGIPALIYICIKK